MALFRAIKIVCCMCLARVFRTVNKLTLSSNITWDWLCNREKKSPLFYSLSEENFVQLLWTTCWILNNRIARCQDQSFKQYMTMSSSSKRFILWAGWSPFGCKCNSNRKQSTQKLINPKDGSVSIIAISPCM